jgi:class 3 adenylate cyclase
MEDFFKGFRSTIQSALNTNSMNENRSGFNTGIGAIQNKTFTITDFSNKKSELTLSSDLSAIARKMGATTFENQFIGHHPHFLQLKNTQETEKHWIISAFIDIKKSTNLFGNYPPETVMIITNTLQLAAIRVCIEFGGFIQRLHGDGLMVYFGGKGRDIKMTTYHALTALSFFCYFMENDLKDIFEEHGVERIKTRIGMDLGYDNDVLWTMAGINGTSEIATVSLHTSLAAKMQAYAASNGIVVGENIVAEAEKINSSCFSVVENERYIFRNPLYTQYQFDWFKCMKSMDFIASSLNGTLVIKPQTSTNTIQHNPAHLVGIVGSEKPWCS